MLTTLHSFDGTDGDLPFASLIQGMDGNFYGTTAQGGTSGACYGGCGTVFKITPGGTLTTLHSFDDTDGKTPAAPLVQAINGVFYGTTIAGGANDNCNYEGDIGCGTVFSLSFPPSILNFIPTIGRVGSSVVITGENFSGATSVTFDGVPARRFTVESPTEIRATVRES